MTDTIDQTSASLEHTPSNTTSLGLPPVKQLFAESWHDLSQNFLKLFVLDLISFFIQMSVVAAFVFFAFDMLGLNKDMFINKDVAKLQEVIQNLPNHTEQLILSFGALALASFFIATFRIILMTSILGTNTPTNLTDHLKKTLRGFIPFVLVGMLVSFLAFGGMFILFFPAVVISIFLMFAKLETVLASQNVISSIKKSVQIVSQNFGDIIVRILVLSLAYIMIVVFIPNLITKIDPEAGLLVQILRLVFNLFTSWYGLAYSIKLFQHAKTNTDTTKPSNILWIVVISLFGWIIAAAIGTAIVKNNGLEIIKTGFAEGFNNAFNPTAASQSSAIPSKAPSSCGISIPMPETTDQKDNVTRKWLFEEIALDPDNFYILENDTYPHDKVLGAFVGYKDDTNRLGGESFSVGYPGLNVYCVENTKKLTLDEYVGLAKTNKKYEVFVDKKYNWGEVEAVAVSLKQFDDKGEQTFNDFGNLAVSKDGNRLIYFRRWSVEDTDPIKETLENDVNLISSNLSYKDVPAELILPVDTNTKPAAKKADTTGGSATPNCKQMNIPGGEFASNKCYSTADYNELNGYISAFNNASFTYNGAAGKANVVCNGFTESFAQQCEQAKKDMDASKASMDGYRVAINAVIARGK